MTIGEAGVALRTGRLSSEELVREALRKAQQTARLNAFITLTAEQAIAEAQIADRELRQGQDRGPLHGIPIAHKDLVCTAGVRTTAGSKVFADYVPSADATVYLRLRHAGAISIGKTNLHEHAYGITSTNPHYGAVRNPCDPERIPGGSSGGSAATVAAGVVFMATGTDTGGSIRHPAACCGIVGLKPTFGRVSKAGVLPLSWSLDHVGPITRTVADAAVCYQAMAGYDPADPCSARRAVPPPVTLRGPDLRGVRLGLPENFYFEMIDPGIDRAVRALAQLAESLGAIVEAVRVPDMDVLNTAAQIILGCEAATVHQDHLASRSADYGDDVRTLLSIGSLWRATDYLNAQRVRRRFRAAFRAVLDGLDALLVPATPITPPRIGQTAVNLGGTDQDVRIASTRFLRGLNPLGLPVLSIPAGMHSNGLPIGAQLIGRPWTEARLIEVGAALTAAL